MNARRAACARSRAMRSRTICAWRAPLALLLALALCLATGVAPLAQASTASKSAVSKSASKGKKKAKPKGKGKHGGKTKGGKKHPTAKKPPGKKGGKKGGAPKYTLIAEPNQVGPVPPLGCATLTVKAFYEVATGPKKTKEFPYHPAASTQKVELSTTFGALSPATTKLDRSGFAKSKICSKTPGVAVVTVTIPSFEPTQFAKQCKQTRTTICKGSNPPPPVTATVTFFGKKAEQKEEKPKEVPGGSQPGGGGTTVTPPEDQPPVPLFEFEPEVAEVNQTVSFDGSLSFDPDGTIVEWSWGFGAPLFGGGGMANTVSGGGGPTPSTSFSKPGVYPVTLTVKDNAGLSNSTTHNVKVRGPGEKLGAFETEPTDALGCSGTLLAFVEIYIPTYAENPTYLAGTATGGCAGAKVKVTHVERIPHGAPLDKEGKPRLDEWGEVKDAYRIEFTIEGGTASQGTIPFTASWS